MQRWLRTNLMVRALGFAAAVFLVVGILSSGALALINPHYTPVDLVYQSLVILRLEGGPPGPCAIADFDGDAVPDVVQPHSQGPLKLQWQTAGGTQQTKTVIVLRPTRLPLPAETSP
ncbi:MAG TPA: hypothetical protein VMY42_06405 [Thermoguttaceae bacterium]|nr:hypothetical protein [Thermoguttaceae bacterium]